MTFARTNAAADVAPLTPTGSDACVREASELAAAGKYPDARARILSALVKFPNDSELMLADAATLLDWGRLHEARLKFLAAQASGLRHPTLYLNLAWVCHSLGMDKEANAHASAAAQLVPQSADAHLILGKVAHGLGRFADAIASFQRVIEIDSDRLRREAIADIAGCMFDRGDMISAEVWSRRAIDADPGQARHWVNLGKAILMQDRNAEACEILQHARDLEVESGGDVEAFAHLGCGLLWTGQPDAAVALYAETLPKFPMPFAHGHYAWALLTSGDYAQGWKQYDFRWATEPLLSLRRPNGPPAWKGQPLRGRAVLVRGEQGAGDVIQFGRFAATLKSAGATVILSVRPEMVGIARRFAGVDRVLASTAPEPSCDFAVPMMSIPSALGLDIDDIPADVPYIALDPERRMRWGARMDGAKFKVGLAWAGNPAHLRDRHRSIAPEVLGAVTAVPGVQFVSLQNRPKAGEVEALSAHGPVLNLGPEFQDFEDTAAAIGNLDLVICVDTAIAHLAGALGKPVWLMLPQIGDFRWLMNRADSPWYPTMRLYRQDDLGDWATVIARVGAELESWVHGVPAALIGTREYVTRVPPRAAAPSRMACITECRHGLLQTIPDDSPCARSLAAFGEYLEPQLATVERLLLPDAWVVEIGAGMGAHSVPMAGMLYATGHALIYERDPVLRQLLHQNLAANRRASRVTVMRGTDTLDDLMLERLDLLKIGDSALVTSVLDGATTALATLRPVVLASVVNIDAAHALGRRLHAAGFRCWSMSTPYFSPDNFDQRTDDVFGGGAASALLAIPAEMDISVPLDGCIELEEAAGGAESQAAAGAGPHPAPGGVGEEARRRSPTLLRALRGFFSAPADVPVPKAEARASAATSKEEVAALLDNVNALTCEGHFAEALLALETALVAHPASSRLVFARATIYLATGRLREAYDEGGRAGTLGLRNVNLYSLLGESCLQLGRMEEAEAWMRRATVAASHDSKAFHGHGMALMAVGRLVEADRALRKAGELSPRDYRSLLQAGICKFALGDVEAAEQLLRRAVAENEGGAEAWSMLGTVAHCAKRDGDAIEAFARAMTIEGAPGDLDDALVHSGIGMFDVGHLNAALTLYEQHLPRTPVAEGHVGYAKALLRCGRFVEGWRNFEFRWLDPRLQAQRAYFARPVWNGQNPQGKTILLRSEGGLGDTIQFIRYAPLLKAQGARVILQPHPEVADLMDVVDGVDHVLRVPEGLPDFDYFIPLMSLPHVFGTTVESIPSTVPYLRPAVTETGDLIMPLLPAGQLKVGLVWADSPAHEQGAKNSIALRTLAALSTLENVTFFSLQRGPAAGELSAVDRQWPIADLGPQLGNYLRTAATIAQLDLVITVDSVVAHLAGAMGKRVWLLLPRIAEFRWMEERGDSPWYPTMRLFRQSDDGEWAGVGARVRAALELLARSRVTPIPQGAQLQGRAHVPDDAERLASLRAIPQGHCAVAYGRVGLLQYLPHEPREGLAVGWYGEWLQPHLELATRILRQGDVAVEVGAGVGAHSVGIARALGPQGHLLVHESGAVHRQVLRRNLGANRLPPATLLGAPEPDVDALRLDRLRLLKFNNFAGAQRALVHCAETIWRLRPFALMRAVSAEEVAELAALVGPYGYRFVHVRTNLFVPTNFNRRPVDIFAGSQLHALIGIPEEASPEVEATLGLQSPASPRS